MGSLTWWERVKCAVASAICAIITDVVKRFVLYELVERAMMKNPNKAFFDYTVADLYDCLEDA